MLRHARALVQTSLRASSLLRQAVPRTTRSYSSGGGRRETNLGACGVGTASVWAGEEEYLVERSTQVRSAMSGGSRSAPLHGLR